MSKCLHNTLNVSHFHTYVLSLKKSERVFFDSLEGDAEAVSKAVLCLLFTLVTYTKNISSLVQLKQSILLLHIVRFFKTVKSQ